MTMHSIIFRGKNVNTNEWVEGFYVCKKSSYFKGKDANVEHIICKNLEINNNDYPQFVDTTIISFTVNPDTVGQYTGLTDCNNNKIFEGDILKNIATGEKEIVQWFDEHSAFMTWNKTKNKVSFLYDNAFSQIRIIGNVYDTPELI